MQDSFSLQQLRACDLFRQLSEQELQGLYSSMVKIHLKAGDVLVKQGDPSDSLHVLLSGRLIVKTSAGKVVGQISRGQTVGEMGLITQEPRSATVIALRDSLLLQLDSQHFNQVSEKHPGVLLEVAKTITRRLQMTLQSRQSYSSASNIVIFPAHRGIDMLRFRSQLSACFDQQFKYQFLNQHHFSPSTPSSDLYNTIQELENQSDYLFYEVGEDRDWRELCLERADHIYVLANANQQTGFDPDLLAILNGMQSDIKKVLVLLHDKWGPPTNTEDWLVQLHFAQHHHICFDQEEDFARLLRFLNGSAVGLVLGGGGTRSWAHVGAIRYLFEQNIAIDAYAGASAGAITAAGLSISRDYQDFLETSYFLANSMCFNEYTIPLASLLSSRSLTNALKNIFGIIKVEDLKKMLFCVAADLVGANEVAIHQGLLWKAVRASAAIPGIYPPVHGDGRLLVDGGVVNNLPVDVMRQYFDGIGKIIAVDISDVGSTKMEYNYPLDLNWRWILRHKILSRRSEFHLPSLAGTLMKGMVLASDLKSLVNIKMSDICIRPVLSGYGLLDLSKKEELLEIGYAAARTALKDNISLTKISGGTI